MCALRERANHPSGCLCSRALSNRCNGLREGGGFTFLLTYLYLSLVPHRCHALASYCDQFYTDRVVGRGYLLDDQYLY